MANPARRGLGTLSTTTSGNMTPGLPSGWAADDIHYIYGVCQDGETLSASGFSHVAGSPLSNATQNTMFNVLWRRAVAGDTGPTVTGATSGSACRIIGYSGCITSGTPHDTPTTNTGSGLTATWLDLDPSSTESMVVAFIGIESQFSSATVAGYSGTNPTFSEGGDDENTAGANWVTIAVADGTNDGTTTGNRTATITATTNSFWAAIMLSLIPVAGGASGQPYRKRTGGVPGMGQRSVW